MTMKCPFCKGRGWTWVGAPSNAYRAECEECGGKGRGRMEWGPLAGVLLVLLSTAFCLWLLLGALVRWCS